MRPRLFAAALAASIPVGLAAAGPVYGIKSRAPDGVAPSTTPADLYVFQPDGSGFGVLGTITLGGVQVDADALALSETHGLLGYVLDAPGWTLARLSTADATAEPIGEALAGRDIRGAVFDGEDRLRVIDAAGDELLRVDPATGAVLDAIPLQAAAGAFDVSNTTDLAIRGDGLAILSSLGGFFRLDPATGLCTPIGTHAGNALAGLAFDADAPPARLLGYEINNSDDIFAYDTASGLTPTPLITGIIPAYNSGRGDLAAVPGEGPIGCNAADLAPPFGLLDLADLNAFVAGFTSQDPLADLDGDGLFDLDDVNLFVASFVAGCG